MGKPTSRPWRITDENKVRRTIRGGSPERSLVVIENWTREEDARLMVAAAEMYEVLKFVRAHLPKRAEKIRAAVDAAILHAEQGEEIQ